MQLTFLIFNKREKKATQCFKRENEKKTNETSSEHGHERIISTHDIFTRKEIFYLLNDKYHLLSRMKFQLLV
jgi:hypothetical protein